MARFDCLECVVGGTSILIPVRDLDRVTEYALTAPPPLSPRWVGGLSLLADTVCASVALAGHPLGPLAACKGLLLRDPRTLRLYVVQVDEVGSITSVDTDGSRLSLIDWPCPGGWLVTGTRDDEDVLRLDTDAVSATLFGEAAEPEGARA